MHGCELDTDGDGVVDSEDRCAETEPGQAVNALGCGPDGDDDAVVDPRDLCPDTRAGVEVDATGCAVDAPITLPGVSFAPDSAELTAASRGVLDRVAQVLSTVPSVRVEVAGHTDSAGRAEYNRTLSQRRAESVVAYLIERGIDADRLSARGYGEEQPVADNATPAGRASNRRVELRRRDGR
jgi:OOP family OmpA-OmpF porin